MTIKKANGTMFEAPNWLVLLGIWGLTDLVVSTAKVILGKKDEKKKESDVE